MKKKYDEVRSDFFDQAETLFSIWDDELNCLDANETFVAAIKIARKELIGMHIADLSPDIKTSGRYEVYKRVLVSGKTEIIDEVQAHPNIMSGNRYFRIKIFKMHEGIGVISKDITDLKIIINDDIEKLKQQATLLQHQNTQLSDFCSIVSHNLRAPLVNLGMLSNFITESDDIDDVKDMSLRIKPVIDGLNETFDYLIETLQIRLDKEIEMDEINLEDTAVRILKDFEPEKMSSNATVKINFDSYPNILYPRKYIDSILSNLISNAFKYRALDRNLELNIRSVVRNGKVLLLVKDNGLGIDLNMHRERLFKIRKVFHKHPHARGFGLFMIKTQIESMGDTINIKSKVDSGSTFYIEFKNQKK